MSNAVKVSDRRRNFILINLIIACFATSLLMTALNTAIHPISQTFGISVTTGQWITSGYSLTMGIVMPLTAFLIRRFATKRLYLIGMAIFLAGLAIDVAAGNFGILMFGRVFQAVGNGILISMAQVIILSIFPPERKGTVMGWYGLAISVAPVIAPTLGGVLVDTISWRAIFVLGLIIVAVAFVMACFVFDNVLENVDAHVDIASFILSVLAFGGITLGVGNVATYGILHPMVWAALAVGVVTFILFIRRQFHMEDPFLDLRIVKVKDYTIAMVGTMMLYFVMMGSSVIMPLYVQSIMGYSATISGLTTLPGSVAMAVISPFAGRIYDRIGIKRLFVIAPVCMFASNIGMFFITLNMPLPVAASFNVVRCICIGCLQMPLITWGTSAVGQKALADASALMSSLRTIAGAIGSAVLVGIMDMVASNSFITYGERAEIHGMNVSFLCMSFVSAALFLIAVFLVKEKKPAQS